MIGGEGRLMTAIVSPGSETRLASPRSDALFVKEDWVLFRNLATLGQKAGVSELDIPKLVAKELVDNALDAAGSCRIELVDDCGIIVSDDGPGIPGDDADVASLFSISRPLTSSKLLRHPTRGALGNGLRVVTGAVVATSGSIVVSTRGRTLRMIYDHDSGTTSADNAGDCELAGTQVEVRLGSELRIDEDALTWANMAIALSGKPSYTGKTSPSWYDPGDFYELVQAAKGMSVRDLVASFEGYAGPKAGQLVRRMGYGGLCRELSIDQATVLLREMRSGIINSVSPKRLGSVGPIAEFPNHARAEDEVRLTGPRTPLIPVAVEAWARPAQEFSVSAFVNRTPITGSVEIYKSVDKSVVIRGCGCSEYFGGNHKPFELWFNIDTPYMPIVTDGKEPDFRAFGDLIKKATQKAAKKIPRENDRLCVKDISQRQAIFQLIPGCVRVASSGGKHRFQQRNLFYKVRTPFMDRFGFAPEYGYFCSVVTEYENTFGEIEGIHRDPRGVVYHPHIGREVPLGTLFVEDYDRPEWVFNKVLYIEKEGLFSILKYEKWPERHDCALMTSKGQGTRAAKDLIDLLASTGEPCEFYIIHDADAAGTMIYECLQEATAARGARKVKIVNLGLEPREGRDLGLAVEDVKYKKNQAVAAYVPSDDARWLQNHRIELDSMAPAELLTWLDAKFASHAKLIPPVEVLRDRLEADVKDEIEKAIRDKVLREARIDIQVDESLKKLKPTIADHEESLVEDVTKALEHDRSEPWTSPVGQIAVDLVS
jgi:hypothetical protein